MVVQAGAGPEDGEQLAAQVGRAAQPGEQVGGQLAAGVLAVEGLHQPGQGEDARSGSPARASADTTGAARGRRARCCRGPTSPAPGRPAAGRPARRPRSRAGPAGRRRGAGTSTGSVTRGCGRGRARRRRTGRRTAPRPRPVGVRRGGAVADLLDVQPAGGDADRVVRGPGRGDLRGGLDVELQPVDRRPQAVGLHVADRLAASSTAPPGSRSTSSWCQAMTSGGAGADRRTPGRSPRRRGGRPGWRRPRGGRAHRVEPPRPGPAAGAQADGQGGHVVGGGRASRSRTGASSVAPSSREDWGPPSTSRPSCRTGRRAPRRGVQVPLVELEAGVGEPLPSRAGGSVSDGTTTSRRVTRQG